MPNYITNIIKITIGDFDEVADFVKSENRIFDFNKLIPCPKEFEQFNGVSSYDEKAVAFWAAYFDNTQSTENKQATAKELLEIPSFLMDQFIKDGLKRYKLWEKYGDFDSYYWCLRHWNCKCNTSDSEIYAEKKTFSFYTACNAPFPIYKALAKKFPNHEFEVYFADLEGLFFAGKAICKKGNVVLLQNYGLDCKELKDNNIKMIEGIIYELKKTTEMITNKQKAKEIAAKFCEYYDGSKEADSTSYNSAMEMAEFKDEQYKLLLDAKEMDCNETKKFLGWLNGTGLTVNEYAQLEAQYQDYINAKDIPTI